MLRTWVKMHRFWTWERYVAVLVSVSLLSGSLVVPEKLGRIHSCMFVLLLAVVVVLLIYTGIL